LLIFWASKVRLAPVPAKLALAVMRGMADDAVARAARVVVCFIPTSKTGVETPCGLSRARTFGYVAEATLDPLRFE
jgi:hypothetical protein